MTIEQTDDGNKGFFKALENNAQAGRMIYTWKGPHIITIDHTEVDPAFAGKGIGKELVMAGVKYARENDIKIIPLCPYAKTVFNKNKEIQDVLFR